MEAPKFILPVPLQENCLGRGKRTSSLDEIDKMAHFLTTSGETDIFQTVAFSLPFLTFSAGLLSAVRNMAQ